MFVAGDSIFLIFLYRSSLSLCCLACIASVVFELFLCWRTIFCLLLWTVSGLLIPWGVHRWLFLLWLFLILKTFQGLLNCVFQYLLDSISTAIRELVNPQACYGSSICPPQNTVDLSSLLGYDFEIGLYIEISRLKYFVPSFELKQDQTHCLWPNCGRAFHWNQECWTVPGDEWARSHFSSTRFWHPIGSQHWCCLRGRTSLFVGSRVHAFWNQFCDSRLSVVE